MHAENWRVSRNWRFRKRLASLISKRAISARSNGRYIRRYEGSLCLRCLKNQIDEEYFKYVRRGVIGD